MEKNLGGPTFKWAGKDYLCVPNEATASKILGLGGFALNADLLLFVRVAVLPPVGPKETQEITFKDRLYRIDKRGMLPGDEVMTLTCNDASEGV